jgi:hypothetical protein
LPITDAFLELLTKTKEIVENLLGIDSSQWLMLGKNFLPEVFVVPKVEEAEAATSHPINISWPDPLFCGTELRRHSFLFLAEAMNGKDQMDAFRDENPRFWSSLGP